MTMHREIHLRTLFHSPPLPPSPPCLQESYRLLTEKVPIGMKSYKHRRDIVFSHTVTTVITSFVFKLFQSMANPLFLEQLMEVGFLVHWESLLSTIGDEAGMLEDFIIAIHDANNLFFKVCGGRGGYTSLEAVCGSNGARLFLF